MGSCESEIKTTEGQPTAAAASAEPERGALTAQLEEDEGKELSHVDPPKPVAEATGTAASPLRQRRRPKKAGGARPKRAQNPNARSCESWRTHGATSGSTMKR